MQDLMARDLTPEVLVLSNPLRRDNPPSFMTRGIAGSQVTLCGE